MSVMAKESVFTASGSLSQQYNMTGKKNDRIAEGDAFLQMQWIRSERGRVLRQCTTMEFAAFTQAFFPIKEEAGNQYSTEKHPNTMPLQQNHHISFFLGVGAPLRSLDEERRRVR